MSDTMDAKIQQIADYLITDAEKDHLLHDISVPLQPDKEAVVTILDKLQILLFPAHFCGWKKISPFAVKYEMSKLLEEVYVLLTDQITIALLYKEGGAERSKAERKKEAASLSAAFLDCIPALREALKLDAQAGFDGDPAAFNSNEIIFSYPGFYAIMVNRIAHELYRMDIPLIPRLMTEHAHGKTGTDIHPGATLGKYFFIDHATGVVIGETTVIGDHVKIYQGVTLGGLSTRAGQGLRGVKRHPTIGDNVTIYSGASILGGETVIGEGCIIAGSSFITHSIPPYTRVSTPVPELQMKPDPKAQAAGLTSANGAYEIC